MGYTNIKDFFVTVQETFDFRFFFSYVLGLKVTALNNLPRFSTILLIIWNFSYFQNLFLSWTTCFKKLQKLEFVSLLHIPLKCVCADAQTCTHNFINIKMSLEIIKLWFTPVISRADFHNFNKHKAIKNVNTVVIGGWKHEFFKTWFLQKTWLSLLLRFISKNPVGEYTRLALLSVKFNHPGRSAQRKQNY